MEIKRVPISDVEVWAENPRNIKTKDFERLKRQIQELGVYKPLICIRENGKYITLGGNMRLRALGSLGVKEVEVSIVKAKDEATKIKYALSDNDRVGQYDEQALAELTYPHIEEINLEDYRIDVEEPISLKDVIEDYAPDIDGEDEIPEIDDSPAITKMGDLFTLGKHRLICGDATKEEDVKRLMNGEKADMVFTDPPYNINMQRSGNITGDNQSIDEYQNFIKITCDQIEKHSQKKAIYLCCGWRYWSLWDIELRKLWKELNCLIWEKPSIGLGGNNGGYRYQHELIWFGGSSRIKDKTIGDVWKIERDNDLIHPTLKPLKLPVMAIKNSSKSDDTILDLFLGSGTTLIACEKLNRICMGMEIEPKYCDVIITRFSNFKDIPEEEIRATRQ